MTKHEVLKWLEKEIQNYPERSTGNECEDYIVQLAGSIIMSDRATFIEALREWIVLRDNRTLLALRIAGAYRLTELISDVQLLLSDVQAGKAYSTYYEEFIVPVLRHLRNKSQSDLDM